MKKKVGLCLIIAVLAVVAAIFAPWEGFTTLKNKLLGIGESYASLKVYSLGGDMKIFVDDEEKGTVREEDSYFEVFPIIAGEHEVKLVREATLEGFYPDFSRVIDFEKGFDTVISWEIGPSSDSSSGWILYAQQTSKKAGMTSLNLTCVPESCNILINGGTSEVAPISKMDLSLDRQYGFKASSDGYQDLEFQLFESDDESRAKLEGYELFLDVNLYKVPI